MTHLAPPSARPAHLQGRFLFLDGLRGVAAFAVALGHYIHPDLSPVSAPLRATLWPPITWLLDHAYLGVEIFFVLSGFVIAHSIWGQRVTPRYAGNFALRRSLRLDPPYWTTIALIIGLPYLVFPTYLPHFIADFGGVRGIVANLFYAQNLLKYPSWLGVAWTLCLEVQFYLAYLTLIALAQFARRRLGRAGDAVTVTMFAALALFSLFRWWTHESVLVNDFGGRWHMFFCGALLYATVAGAVPRRPLAVMLAAISVVGAARGDAHAAALVGTTGAIWLGAHTGGLRTWLSWRPIQWMGHRSYSFYLVHLNVGECVLGIVSRGGDHSTVNAFAAYGFALVASLVVADLMYRLVESPAVRLSARLRPRSESKTRGVTSHDLATGHHDGPTFEAGPIVEPRDAPQATA